MIGFRSARRHSYDVLLMVIYGWIYIGGVLILPLLYFQWHNDVYLSKHVLYSMKIGIVWFLGLATFLILTWVLPGAFSRVFGYAFIAFDLFLCVTMTKSMLQALVGQYWTLSMGFGSLIQSIKGLRRKGVEG